MILISVEKFKGSALEQIKVCSKSSVCPQNYGYTDFAFPQDVHVEGVLSKRGHCLQFAGEAEVVAQLICDRCGGSYLYPLKVELDEYYSLQEEKPDREGERSVHLFSGNEIDLTPEVLQAVFLALPMKRLCKDNCKGLCPGCGINLNSAVCSCGEDSIDPRLEKLKDFVFDDSLKGV